MNKVDGNLKIMNKPFEDLISSQDVEIVMKRYFGNDYKIINYQLQNYSTEKLGFLGAHHHLLVTSFRNNSHKKDVHAFFVKSLPHDIAEQVYVIEDSKAFFKEINFYKRIVPELSKSVKDKSWMAQCYLIKNDVMILEDLKSKNFILKGHFLDIQELKLALTAIANLHASSMLTEKRLGKLFNELYPELMTEGQFSRNIRFYDWFRVSVQALIGVASHLGLETTNIPGICDQIFDKLATSTKWRNVLCHGDLKAYNMMFDSTNSPPKCVLIDFQLIRYCPPTIDVLQMLYLASKRELREKCEEDLLKHYYESLCSILKENDENIEQPTLEEIKLQYEEMRVVGIVTASLFFQIMLLDGKKCAELTKDSEAYAKLYFEDRVDLVLDTMRNDRDYSDAMAEITMEMIERSSNFLIS